MSTKFLNCWVGQIPIWHKSQSLGTYYTKNLKITNLKDFKVHKSIRYKLKVKWTKKSINLESKAIIYHYYCLWFWLQFQLKKISFNLANKHNGINPYKKSIKINKNYYYISDIKFL